MSPSEKKAGLRLWYAVLAGGLAIGVFGIVTMIMKGHEAAFNVTREIPWGILISSYEYFMAASAGLLLIANIGYVFNRPHFKRFARQALILALGTMAAGFLVMGSELSHPLRMVVYALLSPNFQSPFIWVGLAYAFFGLMLFLQLVADLLNKEQLNAQLGVFGLIAAVIVLTVMGAILGVAKTRPLWYGGLLPIYFTLTGIISAGALLSVTSFFSSWIQRDDTEATTAFQDLGFFQRYLILALAVMMVWKLVPGLYGMQPGKYEAVMALLSGPLALNFWLGEVLCGLIIPLGLLFSGMACSAQRVMLAGLSATIGVFAMRYDLLIAGQLVPVRNDVGEGVARLLHYSPSLVEGAIVVGAIATCLMLYTLLEQIFSIRSSKDL